MFWICRIPWKATIFPCVTKIIAIYYYSYGDTRSTSGYLSHDVITLTDSIGGLTAISYQLRLRLWEQQYRQQPPARNGWSLLDLAKETVCLGGSLITEYSDTCAYSCLAPYNNIGASTELVFGSTASSTNLQLMYTQILSNQPNPSYYYVP